MRDGLTHKAADSRRLPQQQQQQQQAPANSAHSGKGCLGQSTSGSQAAEITRATSRQPIESGRPKNGRAAQIVGFLLPFSKASSSSLSRDIRLQRKQKSSSLSIEPVNRQEDSKHKQTQEAADNDESAKQGQLKVASAAAAAGDSKLDNSNKLGSVEGDRSGNGGPKINYWHYKQTGIKSRPIKLLKHPIEHIERKIILTYLLGFLFKFIAIITGPLIVLIVFLITVPFVVLRRATWFILNLPFTFDAKIKTMNENDLLSLRTRLNNLLQNGNNNDSQKVEAMAKKLDKQIHWLYCPFNYLETYWFKEKLVNTVIMLVDHRRSAQFPINKLKRLVRDQILSKPAYRKFLSQAIKRGLPFYKSYYWHYLGLAPSGQQNYDLHDKLELQNNKFDNNDEEITLNFIPETHFMDRVMVQPSAGDCQATLATGQQQHQHSESEPSSTYSSSTPSSSHSSCSQLDSPTSSIRQPSSSNATKAAHHQSSCVQISIDQPEVSAQQPQTTTHPTVAPVEQQNNHKFVLLDRHIFIDKSLGLRGASRSTISRYARQLIGTKLTDMNQPLWEIRLVPASSAGKSYLIFRCHQSLADGKSLSGILTNCLSESKLDNHEDGDDDGEHEEEDENRLSPIKEKPSFVESVTRSASLRSAILVGPLTVLLWVIWTFTRRKNNHLNKRPSLSKQGQRDDDDNDEDPSCDYHRFHMSRYNLTKIHQIKQMTRSTVCDVILCALSGALRDYLRKFNGVTNPPNLNISLAVDMRGQDAKMKVRARGMKKQGGGNGEELEYHHPGSEIEQIHEEHEKDTAAPGVNCTLVNVPLPISVEGTVPRLWELRNTMDELRHSADPWVMLGLQQFLFNLMPVTWYQWLINCIALRNSSTIVSNLKGPKNLVETWCVDLLQRAILESQQAPRTIQTDPTKMGDKCGDVDGERRMKAERKRRRKLAKMKEVKFLENLGSISEIYYCMQPPTSDIPISFNCITYHDKLFLSVHTRTLLVEDSKLLTRLFVRQLDQLVDTIAKRRNLITIIRTPIPIEISCQPASPQTLSALQSPVGAPTRRVLEPSTGPEGDKSDTDEIGTSIEAPYFEQEALYRRNKEEDVEANLGDLTSGKRSGRHRCKGCNQFICTCRRRKSLFSFDHHQRQHNLLSLLIPSQLMVGSRGNKSFEIQDGQSMAQPPIECLCGQQLLEEMDEESCYTATGLDSMDRRDGSPSTGSRTPSDSGGRTVAQQPRPVSSGGGGGGGASERPYCSRCRLITERSTLSLDDDKLQGEHSNNNSPTVDNEISPVASGSSPRLDRDRSSRVTHSSAQLSVPKGEKFASKVHSRSETDLLPTSKSDKSIFKGAENQQRGFKDSWFTMGGKLSMFTKSNQSSQNNRRSMVSPRSSAAHINNSQETVSMKTGNRNLIEMPTTVIEAGNSKFSGSHRQQSSKRRRQSVATSTGASHIHRSVIVKDKVNADVNLRLDNPFNLGIRNRRFSVIGNAVVGSQRRGSLLPFGLIQNQSLPKLFWDDGEAHL